MTIALDGNNPGGILDGAFAQSQPGYTGHNGRYAAFAHLSDGVQAMRLLLLNSYLRKGRDTPAKVANRWAPSGGTDGNDPSAYAQRIARGLGIRVTDSIPPDRAMALTMTMAKIENPAFTTRWAKEMQHV